MTGSVKSRRVIGQQSSFDGFGRLGVSEEGAGTAAAAAGGGAGGAQAPATAAGRGRGARHRVSPPSFGCPNGVITEILGVLYSVKIDPYFCSTSAS